MKRILSASAAETRRLGEQLARSLRDGSRGPQKKQGKARKGALLLTLEGDLGAGKTTFTQGFVRGFGVRRKPSSPTFVIMRRYHLSPRQTGGFRDLYHVDAYRIRKADALESLGLAAVLSDPGNLVLVEWPKNITRALAASGRVVAVRFRHGKKENERTIMITQ
jgi:tRNA threonylcarbamoyladenosine biosynthesis protein TsaE